MYRGVENVMPPRAPFLQLPERQDLHNRGSATCGDGAGDKSTLTTHLSGCVFSISYAAPKFFSLLCSTAIFHSASKKMAKKFFY
jgi:hypothetical protein